MRIGFQTPPEHTTFPELRDVWQGADEVGFAAGFTFDHFLPLNPGERPGAGAAPRRGPQLEGWVTLAALAAHTRRLQVGTLVTGVTYRNPALLAKLAVSLDHASDGRAILGVGAAWHAEEHGMYGYDFPPVGERMTMLDETLTAFRRLCTEEVVDLDGRFVQLHGAVFEPKPVRATGIPVLVGGSGNRLKRICARHADLYNGFWAPWEWRAVNDELDGLLAAAGRRPRDLTRTAFVFADLSGDADRGDAVVAQFRATRGGTEEEVRSRVVVGDPDAMVAVLRSFAAAGVEMAILNLPRPYRTDGFERFAREVMPAVA
jgi:alkanesulfonate monooxygenase SsuD/methylene tetrahydromethanopterin reductase-like flavin-dependent oxidoreductase (luciferase family)